MVHVARGRPPQRFRTPRGTARPGPAATPLLTPPLPRHLHGRPRTAWLADPPAGALRHKLGWDRVENALACKEANSRADARPSTSRGLMADWINVQAKARGSATQAPAHEAPEAASPRISLYSEPPGGEVTLEDFECFAIDRLRGVRSQVGTLIRPAPHTCPALWS